MSKLGKPSFLKKERFGVWLVFKAWIVSRQPNSLASLPKPSNPCCPPDNAPAAKKTETGSALATGKGWTAPCPIRIGSFAFSLTGHGENMNCEVCGKPCQDEHEDFCYGCGHVLCTDCCHDIERNDVIGSPHNIRTHQRMFQLKVKMQSWMSLEGREGKKSWVSARLWLCTFARN